MKRAPVEGTRPLRPLTLCVVSYPSAMEAVFEEIALRLAKDVSPEFVVERCQEPDDVVYLARLWQRRGFDIVRLDLHGHGAGGEFKLGDGMLFASDGTGYELAKELARHLTADADVRLLGCRTASEGVFPKKNGKKLSGAKLLRDLERLMPGRRVWGATNYLGAPHFGAGRLNQSGEKLLRRAQRNELSTSRVEPS